MAKKPPTANFSVKSIQDKQAVIKHIEKREGRFTVTITQGVLRSTRQNKTQRKWIKEIFIQSQELQVGIFETSEDVRAYLKLHIGVPIRRNEDDAFKLEYDKIVKPLPYHVKLELMKEPHDYAVTRGMSTKTKALFLDVVFRQFSDLGYILTDPKWQGWDNIE